MHKNTALVKNITYLNITHLNITHLNIVQFTPGLVLRMPGNFLEPSEDVAGHISPVYFRMI